MTQTPTRNWLITGASSGLGRALTETALAAGDTVIAAMRGPERIGDLLSEHPKSLLPIAFDVRDTEFAPAVVGPAALTRAVRPGMRARSAATIAQMSSQGVHISFLAAGADFPGVPRSVRPV